MVLVVRWFGLVGYDGRFVGLVVCYGGFACWVYWLFGCGVSSFGLFAMGFCFCGFLFVWC